MPTVPTGAMERELRKMYLRWIRGLDPESDNINREIDDFQRRSQDLIERMGGQAASLGALAGFPVPKRLELSPVAGVIYDNMKQAAIQAGIMSGISSLEAARQMFDAGMDKSYKRLERLARTETTNAYWKNSWDSVADLPALVMVWGSEEGPRTCDYCLSREGLVVEDKSIRDHPNGRCTLIPTLRSQVKYRGTLQPDGSVDQDPRWTKKTEHTVSNAPTQLSGEDAASMLSNSPAVGEFSDKYRFSDLNDYIAQDYSTINGGLRTGNLSGAAKRQAASVSEAITHGPVASTDFTVFRGVRRYPDDLVEGAVLKDPAFLSTSLSEDVASRFLGGDGSTMFIIEVPGGTQAYPVGVADWYDTPGGGSVPYWSPGSIMSAEAEVIFQKNSSMTITRVIKQMINGKEVSIVYARMGT